MLHPRNLGCSALRCVGYSSPAVRPAFLHEALQASPQTHLLVLAPRDRPLTPQEDLRIPCRAPASAGVVTAVVRVTTSRILACHDSPRFDLRHWYTNSSFSHPAPGPFEFLRAPVAAANTRLSVPCGRATRPLLPELSASLRDARAARFFVKFSDGAPVCDGRSVAVITDTCSRAGLASMREFCTGIAPLSSGASDPRCHSGRPPSRT
jgi:hypothetical protein